jgi:hypothetical protein
MTCPGSSAVVLSQHFQHPSLMFRYLFLSPITTGLAMKVKNGFQLQ